MYGNSEGNRQGSRRQRDDGFQRDQPSSERRRANAAESAGGDPGAELRPESAGPLAGDEAAGREVAARIPHRMRLPRRTAQV